MRGNDMSRPSLVIPAYVIDLLCAEPVGAVASREEPFNCYCYYYICFSLRLNSSCW